MDNLFKTKEAAEQAADLEYAEVVQAGEQWTIKPILYDVDQAADLLGCAKRKVWQMNAAGELPDVIHPTPGKTRWPLKGLMKLVS